MKIGFHNHSASQMANRMFENPNVNSGAGDDLLLPLVRLRDFAAGHGIECATVDMHPLEAFDAFVFYEMPESTNRYLREAQAAGKPCFLVICENHFLWKPNIKRERYAEFERVFTYNDAVVDGQRVLKMNYAFDLPQCIEVRPCAGRKLAVMICSNQKRDLPMMKYKERRDTINWFQDNHPNDFDLYGLGWERGALAFQTRPILQRNLRRLGMLKLFPRRRYHSWRGSVERKRDVLGKYCFGFCYENTTEISGYITEKIFDVMLAGTVPVYLGPENAGEHLPEACFINRAHFGSHEELYTFLASMTEEHYQTYLSAIRDFISGPESYCFSIKYFMETLLSEVTGEKIE